VGLSEIKEKNEQSSNSCISPNPNYTIKIIIALVDAGVKSWPELGCGVAMGLVTNKNINNVIEEYNVLTDLSGIEDYMSDTDFKIAGTADGITAVQVDVKISGLPIKIALEVIEQSKEPRGVILDIMKESLKNRKIKDKSILPVIKEIQIEPQDRGKFMGVGGSTIKNIERLTG
jgi:polyribonucleotide nucleotidyltransferase